MENTPLLSGCSTNNRDAERGRRIKRQPARVSHGSSTVRPRSAPPGRGSVYLEEEEEEFLNYGNVRSKTSLGTDEDEDEEWTGRALNQQSSRRIEDEEFLNKDTTKNDEGGKSKVMNIVLMNIILIIWSIAIYIHSPVYSQYLYRRIMEEVFGNSSLPSSNHSQLNTTECFKPSPNESSDDNKAYSLQEQAQQLTTETNMKFSLCGYAFSFISTVLFGSYSDYFGRKMLFLIPLVGHMLDFVLVTLIIYRNMDIQYFYVSSVITGICTSEIFSIACNAYVADNTPPKGSRTIGLTFISVTESLTNAALSTGIGYYIQLKGYFLPSLTSASILLLAIVAVICILPERKKIPADSLVRARKKDEKSKLNPLKAIRNVFSIYFTDGSCRTRGMFILILTSYFVHEIAGKMGNISTLWEMNYPLCWTPEMMGYYGTASSVFSQVIRLPLLRILQCFLLDEFIAIWSTVVYIGSLVLKSFSTDNLMMYGVAFMNAFAVSIATVMKSVSSSMVGPDRQGALFASFAIVNILCSILGTPAYSELYKYTLNLFKGTSYLVAAGLQCICLIFLIVFTVLTKLGYKPRAEIVCMQENQSNEAANPNMTTDSRV